MPRRLKPCPHCHGVYRHTPECPRRGKSGPVPKRSYNYGVSEAFAAWAAAAGMPRFSREDTGKHASTGTKTGTPAA